MRSSTEVTKIRLILVLFERPQHAKYFSLFSVADIDYDDFLLTLSVGFDSEPLAGGHSSLILIEFFHSFFDILLNEL